MYFEKPFKIPNKKYYAVLALIGFVAYWPLTLNIFSLKNDATTYFLPWRYHVSEAIQSGYFPFWTPYLYTGLPLHADIQSGVWNPVVFLISLVTKYNMSALQWETFFYILLAGIGFFKLSRFFSFDKNICLVLSVAYMCSGFIIDSGSFIPWIASAAYLPFVFLYALRTIRFPQVITTLKFALSCSLLFLAGYTSFFIFTAYILFFLFVIYLFACFKNKFRVHAIRVLIQVSVAIVLTVAISIPALISYLEFFPYYSRGKGITLENSQTNSFVLANVISYVFPQASYRLNTPNDISSRNAFIGIIPFVLIIYSFRYRYGSLQKLILLTTVFCFLFSLGPATPVHGFVYRFFPLANSFRHPGTIRVFTTIGLLLLSGFGFAHFVNHKSDLSFKKINITFIAAISVFVLYQIVFSNAVNKLMLDVDSFQPTSIHLKNTLDTTTFSEWVVICGIVQLLFLLVLIPAKNTRTLFVAALANIIIISFLSMPFTLISRYRTREVNAFLNSFPQEFPLTEALKNVGNPINDTSLITAFGYKNFYRKSLYIQDHVITPTINFRYLRMLEDSLLRKKISEYPFVYTDSADSLRIKQFSPNSFTVIIYHKQPTELRVTQQYSHNWQAKADGYSLPIQIDNIAFMRVTVPANIKEITFCYRPVDIIVASFISLSVFLGCLSLIIYLRWIK